MAAYSVHFVLLIISLTLCKCYNLEFESRKRRQAPILTELDVNIVKSIDIEARRQILFLIADRLNDTVYLQSTLIENCEKKINETIRQCSNCQACPVKSRPTAASLEALFNKISADINVPITYAGNVVRNIAEWTVGAKSFLGDRWGEFTKTIGGNFIDISNILSKGGKQFFASAVTVFKSLGEKFETVGQDIMTSIDGGLGDTVNDITSLIKKPFADFDSTMGSIGKTISEGATTVKDAAKEAATSVWEKTFGTIFRKRRNVDQCSKQCPSCVKLDMANTNVDEFTESVCGVGSTKQMRDVMDEITFLRDLYNKTTQGKQISSIEYDKTTALSDGSGNIVYTESYFTWNGNRQQLIAGVLSVSSPVVTGEEIAHQYFATEIANRQSVTVV